MDNLAENINKLCIGGLASVVYRHFQIYINREMKMYNVSSAEFMYLLKIADEQRVTQKDLAELTFTDNAIVTRSVQSLEQKGLIVREKSNKDKRCTFVWLTAKGQEAAQAALDKRKEWKNLVMQDLSQQDEETLLKCFKIMAEKTLSATHSAAATAPAKVLNEIGKV